MLKVVVFCGGTGSVALQKGFTSLYGIDRIQMDIIVNAYDNGKSTGVCRRVFNNRILGPSDVRKNQLLQYSIRYSDAMQDEASREARLYQLFNVRLSASDPLSYYRSAQEYLLQFKDILGEDSWSYLNDLLDFFFFECDGDGERIIRRTTGGESFNDFALSNIFYAACAAKSGYSLEAAMDRMAGILGLRDTVHLISDKSVLLMAETQSGHLIEDEGDIVEWDNPEDKIVRALLLDGDSEYIPVVGEESSHAERPICRIVDEADIIIFSSGTQWSSLIPTYMHRGFREMIQKSSAKKYLIMNNVEDHDAYGVSGEELCSILEKYLDLNQILILVNECAVPSLNHVPEKYMSIRGQLSEQGSKKHIPEKLVGAIMSDYYSKELSCHCQLFDLDGTLWNGRGTAFEKEVGEENLRLFTGLIVSGNDQGHIRQVLSGHAPSEKNIEVYADYGNSHFVASEPEKVDYLTDRYFLTEDISRLINEMPRFSGKTRLRGGVVITIKPLTDRERIAAELEQQLKGLGLHLSVKPAGKTSIDVTVEGYTKAEMVRVILEKLAVPLDDAVFIGNEILRGSEEDIPALGLCTLQIDDVFECNTYLKTRHFLEEGLFG